MARKILIVALLVILGLLAGFSTLLAASKSRRWQSLDTLLVAVLAWGFFAVACAIAFSWGL